MNTKLTPVDRAEVTTLADNFTDLVIDSTEMITRPFVIKDPETGQPYKLKAEHGFSALIRLFKDDEVHTVLLDAGMSGSVAVENAEVVGLDLEEVEALVISHGHCDHTWGLKKVSEKFSRPVPAIVHPDAFLQRFIYTPKLELCSLPQIEPEALEGSNIQFKKTTEPTLLAGGCLAVTGEIPRRTDFEKGIPSQQSIRDGEMVPDPLTMDDQSVVFTVKDKGLVIISPCAHSGIINTIQYSLELTGEDSPYTVMGGFHLCWPTHPDVVQATVETMKALNPSALIPCHCTGFNSTNIFARSLPEAFILNTVGSTVNF